MARLFNLAMEELESNDIIDDEVLDVNANPDTAMELTDIETATEEFNQCRDELYNYVLAMEEATDTVEKLVKQVARNNELISLAKEQDVSDVDMVIATETIHAIANDINYNGLDGIRLSQEGFKSNIERLQVANEASEGMIASIIKAIKDFFIKIINMVKKLYIKFMSWLNIYDKKLISLKKDFHNVLYKGKVLIDTELLLKVFELFPFIKSTSYEVNDLKSLFQDRLQIAKWAEHLNPKNIDKTIEEIVNGTFIEKQKTIPYIDAVYERLDKILNKSGKDEYPAIITSFKNGNVTYVSASKGLDHKYTLNDIKTEVIDIPSNMKVLKNGDGTVSVDDGINKFTLKDTSISSRDFSDMADYTSKNLTSNLKEFNDNILKLQNKCKDILDKMSGSNVDEVVKNNLKTIQYLGGRVSVDMCLSIMDSIKNYIKAMVTIHKECVTNLPNYRLLVELYKKHGYEDADIGYLDFGNKYPFVKIQSLLREAKANWTLGGFVWTTCKPLEGKKDAVSTKTDAILMEYEKLAKEKGMDPEDSITNIIHVNMNPITWGERNYIYWHETGHAVMDQRANIDDMFYKMYFNPKIPSGDLNQEIFKYTQTPIEIQADAFACLMTGGTWKTRFYGIGGYAGWCKKAGWSKERIEDLAVRYKIAFEKATEQCRPWANAGCVARLKTMVKSKFLDNLKTGNEKLTGDCLATIQGADTKNGAEHTTCKNGRILYGREQSEVCNYIFTAAFKDINVDGGDGNLSNKTLGSYFGRVNNNLMGCTMYHDVFDDIGRRRMALVVWDDATDAATIRKTLESMGLSWSAFQTMESIYWLDRKQK